MSEIIEARHLVAEVLKFGEVDRNSKMRLERALALMIREPPCRRVDPRTVTITEEMRHEIHRLADTTDMTIHDIADAVGLRNSGRVSEVLNGKR